MILQRINKKLFTEKSLISVCSSPVVVIAGTSALHTRVCHAIEEGSKQIGNGTLAQGILDQGESNICHLVGTSVLTEKHLSHGHIDVREAVSEVLKRLGSDASDRWVLQQ